VSLGYVDRVLEYLDALERADDSIPSVARTWANEDNYALNLQYLRRGDAGLGGGFNE
jgi:hypothetical protein